MSSWTFLLLMFILIVFMIAQSVKLLNSDTKAGELARAFVWSVIDRIKCRKDMPTAPTEKKSSNRPFGSEQAKGGRFQSAARRM